MKIVLSLVRGLKDLDAIGTAGMGLQTVLHA